MAQPRVVVVGAGIVGCGVAEELSRRGWTDVTVLDQGPLFRTGGSTSHAPGLVFQTNASKTMAEFARYTVQKYRGLGAFNQVGGLELATAEDRLTELHRRRGWAHAWGVEAEVVSPERCAELHPLIDPARVLGGLYVPSDGLAQAVAAAETQAKLARDRGVTFLGNQEVLDITTKGRRVVAVVTAEREIPADLVLCCAGIWGPRVTRMVGMDLPLTPLAHQLAWTTPLKSLAADQEAPHPILRHQSEDLYFRERFDRLGIGYYGHRPLPIRADEIPRDAPVMPSMLPFTEDDFAPAWQATRQLLPATAEAKIEEGFNGLFSFTPDNLPLMGPAAQIEGFWVAEAVWITHSAGVARAMAEWLTEERPTVELHECDVNRFEPHQKGPEYVLKRDCQNYIEVYDLIHPLQPMEDPRPLRTSPFYLRQKELDAYFLEATGWERPQWYEANASEVAGRAIHQPNEWASRYWSPIAAAEAMVTRERVALYDMTALKRIEVSGPKALAFLQHLTTGNLEKSVGSVTYCLLLDEFGGVRSDITVARLGEHEFQLGANGIIDIDWLQRHAPPDGVTIRDITAGTCCIGLWGPYAREVVQPLTETDFSADAFRYFRAKRAYVGTVPVTALRLSYVGELGWELYTTADMGLKLWDTLTEAGRPYGLIAAGRAAFTSLRLEKGYRSFGTDMTHEHDPYEAGLGFAVRMDKEDFVGRTALVAKPKQPSRALTCLTLDDVVMGKEPVYDASDTCVGYVTSASWGHTINRGIAYAWLPSELTTPGTTVQIGYFDRRISATVAAEPLFDPEMERLRA